MLFQVGVDYCVPLDSSYSKNNTVTSGSVYRLMDAKMAHLF